MAGPPETKLPRVRVNTLADKQIHLVEDDKRIRTELVRALEQLGARVTHSGTYSEALEALETAYDLIILDLGLPDGDGLELCRFLRLDGREDPVIILTARDATTDCVRGLDLGADDYITKPFQLTELLARVRNVLRRSGRSLGLQKLEWNGIQLDPEARVARRDGEPLSLTRREFDLLAFLLRYPRRVWTRENLLQRVWEVNDSAETRTVDLHVRRLRAKIESDPTDPRIITTIWGVGYALQAPE